MNTNSNVQYVADSPISQVMLNETTGVQVLTEIKPSYEMIKQAASFVMDQPEHVMSLPIRQFHIDATPHSRVGGVYAREMFIPAGTLAIGAIHKYPQLNIMSYGHIDVVTEEGILRIKGPYTIPSPAGTQRIVYAWEDTLWTCITGIDEKDEDVLWDTLYTLDYKEYLDFAEEQKTLISEEQKKLIGERL